MKVSDPELLAFTFPDPEFWVQSQLQVVFETRCKHFSLTSIHTHPEGSSPGHLPAQRSCIVGLLGTRLSKPSASFWRYFGRSRKDSSGAATLRTSSISRLRVLPWAVWADFGHVVLVRIYDGLQVTGLRPKGLVCQMGYRI